MIINSLLDNDLYKFTMMQAVLHQFPGAEVEYEFKCRSGEDMSPYYEEIADELSHLTELRFQEDELDYLSKITFFKNDFIEFLKLFKFNGTHITIDLDPFDLTIKGPWLHTILFEVPVLAIINEVFFRQPENMAKDGATKEGIVLLNNKLKNSTFNFADFGTRRRYAHKWQETILERCIFNSNLIGTSNVYFAKEFDIKPIGTMAHEWIQAGQALGVRLVDSQKFMLQKWVDEYRGELGIALTDTINLKAFLKDFDSYFAKLYDGVRHDSGDPFSFGHTIIRHYKDLGIDPQTKTIVFSDGLNFPKAEELFRTFKEHINVSFGIGTNLTNDWPNIDPISIVMKMQQCNGQPVAKISDAPGKTMCEDAEYLSYLKKVFGVNA